MGTISQQTLRCVAQGRGPQPHPKPLSASDEEQTKLVRDRLQTPGASERAGLGLDLTEDGGLQTQGVPADRPDTCGHKMAHLSRACRTGGPGEHSILPTHGSCFLSSGALEELAEVEA